jgi:hypothetical protein
MFSTLNVYLLGLCNIYKLSYKTYPETTKVVSSIIDTTESHSNYILNSLSEELGSFWDIMRACVGISLWMRFQGTSSVSDTIFEDCCLGINDVDEEEEQGWLFNKEDDGWVTTEWLDVTKPKNFEKESANWGAVSGVSKGPNRGWDVKDFELKRAWDSVSSTVSMSGIVTFSGLWLSFARY